LGAQYQPPVQPAAPSAVQSTAQFAPPPAAAASAAPATDAFGQNPFAAVPPVPPVPPAGQTFTAPRHVADIDKTFGDLFGGPAAKPAAAPPSGAPPPAVPPAAAPPATTAATGQHVIFTAQPSAAGTNNNDDFDAFLNSLGSK